MKTIQMRSSTAADALEFFRDTEASFEVIATGYTSKVILPDGRKFLFSDGGVRPHLFPVAKALKEEVLKSGVPEVNEKGIHYYSFGGLKGTPPARAWCVDLSSAYTFALHLLGLISRETLDKLTELDKVERLRVVGMLATTKTRIKYEGGRTTEVEVELSETRGAFFAACMHVSEVMQQASKHPGFLFYWVDGIFFDRDVPEVTEYFTQCGYPSKVEHVEKLRLSPSRKHLFFEKDGVKKYLSIPRGRQPSPEWMQELLNKPK
jgi:hypothetical protein